MEAQSRCGTTYESGKKEMQILERRHRNLLITRQSVAVQCDGASRLAKKYPL